MEYYFKIGISLLYLTNMFINENTYLTSLISFLNNLCVYRSFISRSNNTDEVVSNSSLLFKEFTFFFSNAGILILN